MWSVQRFGKYIWLYYISNGFIARGKQALLTYSICEVIWNFVCFEKMHTNKKKNFQNIVKISSRILFSKADETDLLPNVLDELPVNTEPIEASCKILSKLFYLNTSLIVVNRTGVKLLELVKNSYCVFYFFG